jgi:hypothetical protein
MISLARALKVVRISQVVISMGSRASLVLIVVVLVSSLVVALALTISRWTITIGCLIPTSLISLQMQLTS